MLWTCAYARIGYVCWCLAAVLIGCSELPPRPTPTPTPAETEEPEEGTDTHTAASTLVESLIDGGRWQAQHGSVEVTAPEIILLSFDPVIDVEPGQDATVHLTSPGDDERLIVGTILIFEGTDGRIEAIVVDDDATITPSEGTEFQGVTQVISPPASLCDGVCAGDYTFSVEIAARLDDGSITSPTRVEIVVHCAHDGDDCEPAYVGTPPEDVEPEPETVEALAAAAQAFFEAACTCNPDSSECAMSVDEDCAREVLWSHLNDLSPEYSACTEVLQAGTECRSDCDAQCNSSAQQLELAVACSFYLGGVLSEQLNACRE